MNNQFWSEMIILLLLCWTGVAQSSGQSLIAQVDRGIVPQTSVRPGWLPVRILFEYQGDIYTARLQVNSEEFNRYTQQMARRERPSDLIARLLLAQEGVKEIAPLVAALRRVAPNQRPENMATFALAFVQSLPYKLDALTTPYDEAWRAPLQTLVDLEIDCEDSSILYSSLLLGLGINNALVIVPGHMLTAVEGPFSGASLSHEGKKYYLAETTGLGWPIGKPPDYKTSKVLMLPVSAISQPPSTHQLAEDETAPQSSNLRPNSSSSGGLSLLLLVFVIIGASLFFGWYWSQAAPHGNSYDDDLEDDPYDDYDLH